jgi:broad specificity phosphatase PhoE
MSWTRIYLLRHGETEWNRRKLFRGHSSIELSERGRGQALAAARALVGREMDAIFTSPIKRAVETAEFCSRELGLETITAPALSDPDCGLWTGNGLSWAEERHPDEFWNMNNRPSQLRFPGGESVQEVYERVSDFIHNELDDLVDGPVLLVTHNFIFQVMTMAILGCSLDNLYRVEMDNGGITEYARDQDVKMVRMNLVDHLRGI